MANLDGILAAQSPVLKATMALAQVCAAPIMSILLSCENAA